MNNRLSASLVSFVLFLILASGSYAFPRSCAMKSNEQGGFDSGVPASTLWSSGFTLSAWVMPEYVYADRGPIFGLSSGSFWVGAGPFRARKRNAKHCSPYIPVLRVQLGSESVDYLAPSFERDEWSHVALTWTPHPGGAEVRLFVNAVELLPYRSVSLIPPPPSPPPPPGSVCPLLRDATDPAKDFTSPEASTAPTGTLFVGTAGDRYFYGLIDDATIQNEALSSRGIAALAAGGAPESRTVVWRDTFNATTCEGQIGGGLAVRVPVDRDSTDAALFDDPDLVAPTAVTYQLPFAPGEIWVVVQGFDSTVSHNDFAAFSYDFALTSGQTALTVVYTSAPGTMVHVDESENPRDGTLESNHVVIQTAAKEATYHRHLEHGSVSEIFFDSAPPHSLPHNGLYTVPVAAAGIPLARVADNNGPHLHFGIRAGWGSDYTVPLAFTNYELMVSCGTGDPVKGTIPPSPCWMAVEHGIPKHGTFVRLP
jgi:Concanavalin A-like lectin/glucanases superfamily